MTPLRVGLLCCALTVALASAGPARADEVEGTLACCHRRCKACYDPCEPVGPVRRVLRRVFLRPCPPPCPAPVAVVIAPPPAPQCAPPARIGQPFLPPAPAPAPGSTSESPFPSATSSRPKQLTPPTPPQPVRLDHLASRNGE